MGTRLFLCGGGGGKGYKHSLLKFGMAETSAVEKVGQDQIHKLLFEDKLSWQSIIYDLINTEQLDPWNIDLCLLSAKFMERARAFDEANFFVSSKVLLAASLLLRIKSEIVLNEDIPTLDEILFGTKEEVKPYVQERIELDGEPPALVPRTPLPRFRRVTLEELMSALSKAIKTENRRIKREILVKQHEWEIEAALPKHKMNVHERIKQIHSRLLVLFEGRDERLPFSSLVREGTQHERILDFAALLHLDMQQRVWLEQEGHFEEIWVWLKHLYERKNADELERRRLEVEKFMRDAEHSQDESDKVMNESFAGESLDDDASAGFSVSVRKEDTNEDDEF